MINETASTTVVIKGDAITAGSRCITFASIGIVHPMILAIIIVASKVSATTTAISTDTGCFVYASTSAYTHSVASSLANAGAEIAKLNKLLFRTKTSTAFEIERRALDSLEYFYNSTIACMVIKSDWITELGATEDDMEGISSIPTQIEGVLAAATFRQIGENEYKLSVRSTGLINASKVCAFFGGGGHKMAAGCTMQGDYNSLKKLMADKLYEDKND